MTTKDVYFFGKRIFYYFGDKGIWWFRLFGWGICYQNLHYNRLSFSLRNNYKGYLCFGYYVFEFLPKYKRGNSCLNS